ncbi:ABC transporter ATP-binding protein [Leifsonia sp. LS1]|uniref:ABC transporter ATP-binding protein n=1 Tax=Leifsonia sp. LS1 TaxID=2828483 RepID=UPI001CFD1240|nr:ABC transporter ATP-binding protein [Leifsonia sp. LS1]
MSAPAQPTGRREEERNVLPVARGRTIRAVLRRSLRGAWAALLGGAGLLVVGAGAGLGVPAAIGWIAQLVTERAVASALFPPLALLAGCAVVGGAAAAGAGVLLGRAVLPALGRIREEVVDAAVRLPVDIAESSSGDLVARVTDDVEQVAEVAQGAFARLLGAAITILVTLAGLAGLDYRFALAALVAVPVQAWTLRWYLRSSTRTYARSRRAVGTRAATLLETFAALPTVRAYDLGADRSLRARAASEQAVAAELDATRTMTRFYGRLNLAEFLGLGAILVVAFVLVRAGGADVGQATAAALFFAALFDPVNVALGTADDVQRAGAGLARLAGVIDAASAPPPREPAPRGHDIVVRGAVFGYDGTPVLHEIDLRIPAGQRVAIVGTTGSGKSTLASLIAGVRRPDAGSVLIGGTPIADVDAAVRSSVVALVAQEPHVFAGSIADGLRLGADGAGEGRVRRALVAAGAAEWVDLLPDGMDTRVGAGGLALAPHHAQHLALARVLLMNPGVVVLDEATAEAGSDSARTLDAAARRVVAGRTAVIVAHRLDHAREADRVVVLEGGRIVEDGTPQRLIAAGGAFARLVAVADARHEMSDRR